MSDFSYDPDGDNEPSGDDFTLDFSGVKAAKPREAMPAGWYRALVIGYENQRTSGGKKLPVGTPGTNWEFVIQEPAEHETRHCWTNQWHHPDTLGFMKALFEASGAFTPEELEASLSLADRDRVVDCEVMIKLRRYKYNDEWRNDINGFAKVGEQEVSTPSASASVMP
jgi:hypothetical protein